MWCDCFVWRPEYLPTLFRNVQRAKRRTTAGATHAGAGLPVVGCAVRSAHDMQSAVVEELSVIPVQFNRNVTASVDIAAYGIVDTDNKSRGLLRAQHHPESDALAALFECLAWTNGDGLC